MAGKLTEKLIRQLSQQVETKIRSGDTLVIEEILREHPHIVTDEEAVMELVYAEIATLDELQRPINKEEFFRRFPDLSERIDRLITVHQSFRPGQDDAPTAEAAETDTQAEHLTHPGYDLRLGPTVSPQHPRQIDDYELLEQIGVGGMGVVYKARQGVTDRLVAIKLIKSPVIEPSNVQRLLNEARATASLVHDNIVQVYHAGTHQNLPYLCLEYVEGGSLADRISDAALAPRIAAELLLQISRGVAHAHEQGIVHRDLKPANVLLTKELRPKIVDFGLAKFALESVSNDDKLTRTGAMLGSLVYMAPEQLSSRADDVNESTDIYALGVILYEMLTGHPPFASDTPLETAQQIKNREPASIRKSDSSIPSEIEIICLRCLQKNPGDRFSSVSELSDELQRFLEGRAIRSQRTSSFSRAWKWAKRNPSQASLLSAVILLLLILAIGGAWTAWTQYQLRQIASQRATLAEQAETRAEQKAEEAKQIADFVIETLRSPDPNRGGRNLTILDRLDHAQENLENDFPVATPTKASLLLALGKTYAGLGEFHVALPVLKSSHDIFSQQLGAEDPSSLEAELELGKTYETLADFDRAIIHLRHTADGFKKLHGLEYEPTLDALISLAYAQEKMGRTPEAGANFELALEAARRHFGETADITFAAIQGMSTYLRAIGELQKADELLQGQVAIAEQTLDVDHLMVIALVESSASVNRGLGKTDQAIKLYERALRVLEEKLTEKHSRTEVCMNNLAIAYADAGRREEAYHILQKVLKLRVDQFGEADPRALVTKLNLGACCMDIGKHDKALTLLSEAYEGLMEIHGEQHPMTLHAMARYGQVLVLAEQVDRGLEVLEECVAISNDPDRFSPGIHFGAKVRLATAYELNGQAVKAIEILKETIDQIREWQGDDHPLMRTALNSLAGAYSAQGDTDSSIETYESLIASMAASYEPNHPHLLTNKFNLAMVHRDREDYRAAMTQLKEVERDMGQEANDPWLFNYCSFQIGRCQLDLGETVDGLAQLDRGYQAISEILPGISAQKRSEFQRELNVIATQLEAMGESGEAAKWRSRATIVHADSSDSEF